MKFYPKLSVITVVYNNVHDIERTVRSVLAQQYTNIEYLVIDGNSTDGTLEVLNKYKDQIHILVSEPDKGIYDAMNKGLALASGDYVLFMNSGDEIYAPDTVKNVFSTIDDADVYYGETEMFNEQWQSLGRRRHRVPLQLSYNSFRFGMSVSHQAVYVRRSLCSPYNPKYKLSADIDWLLAILKVSRKVVNVHSYVAKYLVGGMSKKRHKQSLIERYHIFKEHYGFLPNLLNHLIIAVRLGIYYIKHRRTND